MSRKNEYKKALRLIIKVFLSYLLYVFIFAVFIFNFIGYSDSGYGEEIDVKRHYGTGEGPDEAVLIESAKEGAMVRLHLLQEAQESIDIAYFTLHSGVALDAFMGGLIQAANRGVDVRIVLDGAFHNLRFGERKTLYSMEKHPNIHLRLYEEFSFIKPWTVQNRLHDKFIIIDGKKVLIGGRNIGDKYFPNGNNAPSVKDRDVLLINTQKNSSKESVLVDIEKYFELLWNHEYSQDAHQYLFNIQEAQAKRHMEFLELRLAKFKSDYPEFFSKKPDILNHTHKTKNVSFIHNPIQRWKKEPWVLMELSALVENAKEEVIIQSPYIIPTKEMQEVIINYREPKLAIEKNDSLEEWAEDVTLITNSVTSNPNIFARVGAYRYKEKVIKKSSALYAHRGEKSLHAKTLVIDDNLSVIGSFNMDPRSAFLSTESMVVIHSESFTKELEKKMGTIKESSRSYSGKGDVGSLQENFSIRKVFLEVGKRLVIPIKPML